MRSFSEALNLLTPTNVSRETLEKFTIYRRLLVEASAHYNLVGASTLVDVDSRHFLDSAQLISTLDPTQRIADVGSGAGFPGLVLAILGCENIFLFEGSEKKCRFLDSVSRETSTPVVICNQRTEEYRGEPFRIIVSRAMAPLDRLLEQTQSLCSQQTEYCLLKGERGNEEIQSAQKIWSFTWASKKSITHSKGLIIQIKQVEKKRDQNNQHCKSKGRRWQNNNNC